MLNVANDLFPMGPAKPTIVLLGQPKAGTTSVHSCLTASPGVCCRQLKELSFFDSNFLFTGDDRWGRGDRRKRSFDELETPRHWPKRGQTA